MTRDSGSDKAAVYEQFARIGKALANPGRLELLDLLAQGERTVEGLAGAAAMKVSNTSAQLKVLLSTGLVVARRDGVKMFYRLADEQVAALVDQVKDLATARLADAERATRRYLGDVAALERVEAGELARRLNETGLVVVDVRPVREYAAAHIPGAVNVPHDQLTARLPEFIAALPDGADIVAYCRGRYCVFAFDAVRLLHQCGHAARVLDGGLPRWRRAGLPLRTGRTGDEGEAA